VLIDGQPPRGQLSVSPLVPAPTDRRRPCAGGDPVGNGVEPRSQRITDPERICPSREDEERGLKSVLCVVLVPEDAPAQAHYDRSVALDKHGEGTLGRFPATGRELFEQLTVRYRVGHALVEKRDKRTQ